MNEGLVTEVKGKCTNQIKTDKFVEDILPRFLNDHRTPKTKT
jgi:hypothetical protein